LGPLLLSSTSGTQKVCRLFPIFVIMYTKNVLRLQLHGMRHNTMYRSSKLFLSGVAFAIVIFAGCTYHRADTIGRGEGMDEDVAARTAWETQMLADPATGKIPENIRAKEIAFAATLPVQPQPQMKNGSFWQSRGPWNVGGRTRSIAIDVTNENIILAGSVSGGIYRSTDGGANWTKITGQSQDLGITCIAQNKRQGKTNIWYAGTGELIGASASGGGAFYLGDGILKSTDGGKTWAKLPSTSSGTPQYFDKPFDLVTNIAINEADTGDVVYASTGANTGSIYKSVNGGKTWTNIKGTGFSSTAYYTDVAVSKTGVVYNTRSNDGTAGGMFRSPDGVTFANITPPGFAAKYDRVVIGIDPNDENSVYFLANTPGYGKKEIDFRGVADYASFWKYHYISGNGAGVGGQWTDLTNNIPSLGGDFGNFNTQTGYDLYVRVKPGDSKTVFLGCTNLWRSTDAFATTNNISWIGGYGVNTTRPNYKLYPNNHPDQHNMVFYPSNPNKMLTSCDGGVFRCDDNSAANVTYTSLNNGYLTTQFYTIAIDHATPGNDEILGGLQDNGSWLTRSADQQTSWTMPGNGDGSYAAIADGRTDYYVSSQLGKTFHIGIGTDGITNQWGRVDPLGAKGQLFVDPYTLDPNNQKRMYYIGKNRIWRNDDVTQIPMHSNLDTVAVNTGWAVIPGTKDTTTEISALALSRKPADRLYYGTTLGRLYRTDTASGANPTVKNITSPLFPKAYINCIAVSPVNADHFIVVFSNYSVISLFYTTDGGLTFTNISANLEQNADGSGNGPSCRWAAILPMNNGGKTAFFIGTSTGLYATDSLKGPKTAWTQQSPDGIANNIVTMIDTRQADGLVALSTHGNGVYTAHINFAYQVSGIENDKTAANGIYNNLKCYPNPIAGGSTLMLEFENESGSHATAFIVNEEGKTVSEISALISPGKGPQKVPVPLPDLKKGIYYIRVQTGGRAAARSFVVE
jgi:photosystem II stability/assembly factor-like uncharacterized protein